MNAGRHLISPTPALPLGQRGGVQPPYTVSSYPNSFESTRSPGCSGKIASCLATAVPPAWPWTVSSAPSRRPTRLSTSGLAFCPPGISCGPTGAWGAGAGFRAATAGRCASSCCPPVCTLSPRVVRTPSVPCRPAREAHLLLPGLWRPQPLQPGFPELESPVLSKILRTGAFAYPFLFDNLPLFYQLGLCWDRGHSCGQEALSTSHGYHLLCALLTGFLFTSHLPERLAPGRFGALTMSATAISCSTSVQCWAPTSSWRWCWLIWDLAKPGWPRRTPT